MSIQKTCIGATFTLILAFVSGCVTTTGASSTASTQTPAPISDPPSDLVTDEFFRIGQLPAQTLTEGECGLFLFSGRPSPRFVFYGEAASGRGKMLINDKETLFVRTEGDGEVFQLHFTRQVFREPVDGLEVIINVEPEDAAPDQKGQRIASGTLKMSSQDGWTLVMPVGGAATCESS